MARGVLRILKVRETGNAEFWVSHLFIMVSTVIGVFLAAQAGFTTALQFEVAKGDRDGYYMRRALLDEVKDNVAAVDEWGATMEKTLRNRISADYFLPTDNWVDYWAEKGGWQSSRIKPDDVKMQTFVWDTMKQQTITFQLAPQLLSGVRRYYDAMEGNMKEMQSTDWKSAKAAKTITEDTKRMREEVIPAFEKDIADLRDRLTKAGVPLK
jgi:hypothetical protein